MKCIDYDHGDDIFNVKFDSLGVKKNQRDYITLLLQYAKTF